LADTLMAKRGFAAALDLLNATPDRQKGELGVTVRRNRALMEAGSWDEAERNVRAGLARQRTDEILVQEARIRMHRKDIPGARRMVEEILSRVPDHMPALEVLAEANAAEGRKAETLRELDRLAARVPHSAAVQRYRGVQLLAAGRGAEAREALAAARAADPNDLAAAMSLAQMDIDAGRPAAARETLASLPKRHRESVAALVLRALAEERLSNPQGAATLYRQVLERDGDNMMALNNLAFLLSETEMHPDQALPFAQRAEEISKGNPAVEDTLGWVYYRKGLYPMAQKYLESSVGKQPTASRKYHLAMTYLKQGERTKGQRLVEEIRRVDPALAGNPALRELLRAPDPQR
jgi:tetratricopeptide (TPR) repeat protein